MLVLFLVALSTKGLAQSDVNPDCGYNSLITGVWTLDDYLEDLSGEDLETDGQSWEISRGDASEMKGKITLTFFRDGSFSGQARIEETPENVYGTWKISSDCNAIVVTLEGEDEIQVMKIIRIEENKLMLEAGKNSERARIVLVK